MGDEHIASSWTTSEWTRFWSQNERQIMNYESIFAGTIRKHEWRAQYANHILGRQLELAPAGTLKVHEFCQRTGESFEPKPEPLRSGRTGAEAMECALRLHSLAW